MEAAKEKRAEKPKKWVDDSDESAYDDEVLDEDSYEIKEEKPGTSLTANLPEIDLDALNEAEKRRRRQNQRG